MSCIIPTLGQVAIEKGPRSLVAITGGSANFSCTLNVTGNEKLQFHVHNMELTDNQTGCEIDRNTYTRTVCSWPANRMSLTCEYSIPYQITCTLTLSELSTADSSQITCSSSSNKNNTYETAVLDVIGKAFKAWKLINHLYNIW